MSPSVAGAGAAATKPGVVTSRASSSETCQQPQQQQPKSHNKPETKDAGCQQAVPPSIAHLYASSASLPSPTQRMLVELSGSPVRRRRFATESPASHASTHSQDRHQTAPSTLSRVSPPTAVSMEEVGSDSLQKALKGRHQWSEDVVINDASEERTSVASCSSSSSSNDLNSSTGHNAVKLIIVRDIG